MFTLKELTPDLPKNHKSTNPLYGYTVKILLNEHRNDPDLSLDFDIRLSSGKNLQRGHVWSLKQKQELIMSVLIERRIPAFYFIHFRNDKHQTTLKVLDGKQRLTALFEFVKDKFPINVLGEDYLYSELPEWAKSKVLNFDCTYHVIYEYEDTLLSDKELVALFELLNFSGTPQDESHLTELKQSLIF